MQDIDSSETLDNFKIKFVCVQYQGAYRTISTGEIWSIPMLNDLKDILAYFPADKLIDTHA